MGQREIRSGSRIQQPIAAVTPVTMGLSQDGQLSHSSTAGGMHKSAGPTSAAASNTQRGNVCRVPHTDSPLLYRFHTHTQGSVTED